MPSIQSVRGGHAAAAVFSLFVAFGAPALAQQPPVAMTRPLPAPPSLCAQFDVTAATVQYVAPQAEANGDIAAEVELGGVRYHLALQPFDVRSPDFQLLVDDGNGVHAVPTPPSVTYRGSLLEDPASVVAATVVGGSVTALVYTGTGDGWAIQPVGAAQRGAGPSVHIVYRSADNAPMPWGCGVQGGLTGPVPTPVSTDVSYICQIACEADPSYYALNGSNTTNTQNDITGVVNAMTTIYQSNVQISFTITQILVQTGADPYSSSVAGTLLGQFANNWNNTHGSITRDTAHLFTGRPMGQASGGAIGIAYVGVVCNQGLAYGVSQSRWTNNFTSRVAVTAHEVGHNFNANHCDAVPPCNIMCSGVGGCNNNQTSFSTNERNQITAFANSIGCLQIVPNNPVITAATPSTTQAFAPGQMQLTGTGFLGTTQVQVGSTVMTTGFTVSSNTNMTINLPQPTALGLTTVTVTNSAGTSNAWALIFTATNPAALTVPPAVLGGTTLTWNFGGQPNNVWVLLIGGANTTVPFQGWPVLAPGDVFALGFLSPNVGLGSHAVGVPAGTFAGQTVYSQIAELVLGASDLTVQSSSPVRSTIVIN